MDASDGKLLHVISNIGFATVGKSALEMTTADFDTMFNDEFLPSFRAAQQFIKLLGDVEGSTVTLSSGGFGYGLQPTMSKLYGGSVKNALLNNTASCFNAAVVDDGLKVKVQVVSIFYGVSRKGETKNQFGFPSDPESGHKTAQGFLAVLSGKQAGTVVDLKTAEDGAILLESNAA